MILIVLRRHLHLSATLIGVEFAVEGLGNLLGTILFATFLQWVPRKWGIVLGASLGSALCAFWFGINHLAAGLILILSISSIAALYSLNIRTYRQEIVPQELFGRVISTFRMVARIITPFAPVMGSWVIAKVGVSVFFLGLGIGGLILTAGLGLSVLKTP